MLAIATLVSACAAALMAGCSWSLTLSTADVVAEISAEFSRETTLTLISEIATE